MLRIALNRVVTLAVLWAAASLALATPAEQPIDWQDLRPAVRAEDNPFATLTDAQLDALQQIVLARVMQQRGLPMPESARERSTELGLKLREQGLEVDALLARRDAIIVERQAASEAGVAELDGANVRLIGFLLPAGVQGAPVDDYLLVPWAGACSHTPPPPPNQIVRVKVSQRYGLAGWIERVTVSGRLQLRPGQSDLFLVDGTVGVKSTYAIDDAVIKALPPEGRL